MDRPGQRLCSWMSRATRRAPANTCAYFPRHAPWLAGRALIAPSQSPRTGSWLPQAVPPCAVGRAWQSSTCPQELCESQPGGRPSGAPAGVEMGPERHVGRAARDTVAPQCVPRARPRLCAQHERHGSRGDRSPAGFWTTMKYHNTVVSITLT